MGSVRPKPILEADALEAHSLPCKAPVPSSHLWPLLTLSADQCGRRCCGFWCILSIHWACFSEVMVQPEFRKLGQTSSRPPSSDHDFLWRKFGYGKCFGASFKFQPPSSLSRLLYKIHFSLLITIRLRNSSLLLYRLREDDTLKQWFFLSCSQLMRHPLFELFHLSNLLQRPNSRRMVDVEFGQLLM